MSAIIKMRHMPLIQKCAWNHFYRNIRNISTSKKNRDSAVAAETAACEPKKNWVSYGFDYTSEKEDSSAHHASFFFSVTLCLVFGGFAWGYAPDVHLRDWAQREAFLELRRRERSGLKPVDPNYVDPKTVYLPSEAELCDIEIVI